MSRSSGPFSCFYVGGEAWGEGGCCSWEKDQQHLLEHQRSLPPPHTVPSAPPPPNTHQKNFQEAFWPEKLVALNTPARV